VILCFNRGCFGLPWSHEPRHRRFVLDAPPTTASPSLVPYTFAMSSTPSSPLSLAEKRSWTYWFIDGSPQLLIGLAALLFGVYLISSASSAANAALSILALVSLCLYLLILLRATQILEWLKARITYPRTGYTATPYFADRDSFADTSNLNLASAQNGDPSAMEELRLARAARSRRLLLTYILIIGGSFALGMIHAPWICALIGIVTGAALWLATRQEAHFSWIIVLGFPLLGFYLTTLEVAPRARIGYFDLGAGFLFLLEGVVTLLIFLRRNPAVAERTSSDA
jgi:hypothetical protein